MRLPRYTLTLHATKTRVHLLGRCAHVLYDGNDLGAMASAEASVIHRQRGTVLSMLCTILLNNYIHIPELSETLNLLCTNSLLLDDFRASFFSSLRYHTFHAQEIETFCSEDCPLAFPILYASELEKCILCANIMGTVVLSQSVKENTTLLELREVAETAIKQALVMTDPEVATIIDSYKATTTTSKIRGKGKGNKLGTKAVDQRGVEDGNLGAADSTILADSLSLWSLLIQLTALPTGSLSNQNPNQNQNQSQKAVVLDTDVSLEVQAELLSAYLDAALRVLSRIEKNVIEVGEERGGMEQGSGEKSLCGHLASLSGTLCGCVRPIITSLYLAGRRKDEVILIISVHSNQQHFSMEK